MTEKQDYTQLVKPFIKSFLGLVDKSISDVASATGTNRQNLNKKIVNGSLRLADALEIADVLGYEIKFIKKS